MAVRYRDTFDQAITVGRKVITNGPGSRSGIDTVIHYPGLERFPGDIAIPVVIKNQPVDIVPTDINRQITPPVLLITLIDDTASRFNAGDVVGAGARMTSQGWGTEITLFPVVLGQDG